MKNIFFILAFIILFKYWLSIVLICNKLKKNSYITELALSFIILWISCTFLYKGWLTLFTVIGEYLINKLLVYINIILIKKFAFRILVWTVHKHEESKFCSKLKKLYEIDYGRKLKHGLPMMANQVHEKTGIRFDRNGFPKFKQYASVKLNVRDYKETREHHFYVANKILYEMALKKRRIRKLFTKSDMHKLRKGQTPPSYTWHHHQRRGKMQLVSREIHSLVNHIGGYSIWGRGE